MDLETFGISVITDMGDAESIGTISMMKFWSCMQSLK
jgi:hypothetical protein